METNNNNFRGNGNSQNHNNVNNNAQAFRQGDEVRNCVQSGTFGKVAQHINQNKNAYRVGVSAVLLAGVGGLGYLAYKWIKKNKKGEPAPAAEPKPATQAAAGESKQK